MRPHRLAAVVDSIAGSTSDYRIAVIAATGPCADAAKELPVDLIEDSGGTWAQRINKAFAACTEPFFMTGADDLAFRPGWFEAALIALNQIPDGGVIAVNDLHNLGGVHFIFDRRYLDSIGGVIDQPPGVVCCESYVHSYVDDEIRTTAIYHNRWGGVVRDSVVEHLHCGAGKAPHDAVYAAGEASMSQGHAMYTSRAHLWNG